MADIESVNDEILATLSRIQANFERVSKSDEVPDNGSHAEIARRRETLLY